MRYLFCVLCFLVVLALEAAERKEFFLFQSSEGSSYGFFFGEEGYFLADGQVLDGVTTGELLFTENTRFRASLLSQGHSMYRVFGYALLQVHAKRDFPVPDLGDSDALDVGDLLEIPGVGKGRLLLKKQHFNAYAYPCFITNLKTQASDSGKPVYNVHGQVVGIFLVYHGLHLVVPINDIQRFVYGRETARQEIPRVKTPPAEENSTEKQPETQSQKAKLQVDAVYDLGRSWYHFASIGDIAFDRRSNLYVIDDVFGRIKKIAFYQALQKLPTAPPQPAEPPAPGSTSPPQETKAQKTKPLKKAPPVLQSDLQKPLSLTITDDGLIYVLDHGAKKLVILNDELQYVSAMDYSDLAEHLNPLKVRAFQNSVFLISQNHRLYELEFDKSQAKVLARPIRIAGYNSSSITLSDLTYSQGILYLLNQKTREIWAVDRNNTVSKIPLRAAIPVSVHVFDAKLYVFDKLYRRVEVYENGRFVRYWDASVENAWGRPEFFAVSESGVFVFGYCDLEYLRFFNVHGETVFLAAAFLHDTVNMAKPVAVVPSEEDVVVVNGGSQIARISQENVSPVYVPFDSLNARYRSLVQYGGKLFVGDVSRNKVFACADAWHCVDLDDVSSGLGNFQQLVQMTANEDFLYILDKENSQVVQVNKTLRLVRKLLIRKTDGALAYAQDITVAADGSLYVLAENRVLCYSPDLQFSHAFPVAYANAQFSFAKGMTLFQNMLYVADTYNHRVLVYTLRGECLADFGSLGDAPDQFFYPWDLQVFGEKLYVVDRGNHRVVCYGRVQNAQESQEDSE